MATYRVPGQPGIYKTLPRKEMEKEEKEEEKEERKKIIRMENKDRNQREKPALLFFM